MMKKYKKKSSKYGYVVRFWYKERSWEVIVYNDEELFDILNNKDFHVYEVEKLYTDRKAVT